MSAETETVWRGQRWIEIVYIFSHSGSIELNVNKLQCVDVESSTFSLHLTDS